MLRRKGFMTHGLVLLGWLTTWTACEPGFPAGSEPHRELNFTNMRDQPKYKPQRGDLLGDRPTGMLAPPAGALATDEVPYIYDQKQGDQAGAALENPLQPTARVLAKGKFIYDNVCIVCHGPKAAGDGHLTRLFPKPPSLMTQKIRDWTDGRIYHLPMRGQGSMPSHATQVEPHEIWSVIHHIRALQKKEPVAPPDIADKNKDTAGTPPDSADKKKDTAGAPPDSAEKKKDTAGTRPDSADKKKDTAGAPPDSADKKKDTAVAPPDSAEKKKDTTGAAGGGKPQ